MGAEFRFDEEKHLYYLDGVEIPHVTEILKEAGLITARGTEYDLLRGRYVHKACHLLDQGNLDRRTLDAVLVPYVEAYRQFRLDYDAIIVASEMPVYSKVYRYAGTLDRVIENKTEGILEIKTGNPEEWHALQLAGYLQAYEEEYGLFPMVRKRYGLYLTKEGNYKFIEYKDKKDKQIFLSILAFVNWKRNHK